MDDYNGYNLIGNPYPSTIDFHQIPKGTISDQLIAVKPNGSQASYIQSIALGNNGGTRYIQPGQAFYLIANQIPLLDPATSTTLTFQETFKASAQTASNGFLSAPKEILSMSKGVSIKNSPLKVIRLNLKDSTNTDETTIAFQEGQSADANSEDVLFLSGSTVSLSSLSADNKGLAINLMPDLKVVNELRLNINASANGLLKLNFTDLKSTAGYQVFLKDALFPDDLNDVKADPVYEFSIDKAKPATYGKERFSIIFKPEPIEPPVLFTAEKIRNAVELNWVAENAKDIQYFEIETSTDGSLFMKAGEVKNAGSSLHVQYSFIDKTPLNGLNYYRVKQINKNGHYAYTPVKSVDLSAVDEKMEIPKIIVYPNPATERIQVQLPAKRDGSIDAVVLDLQGKKIYKATFKSDENLSINVNQLKPGIYIVELKEAGSKKMIGHSKFTVGL